jgi:GH15 family glucan-1,4-alpha-glucosidase
VRLGLSATVHLEVADGDVRAEMTLRTGQTAVFILEVLDGDDELSGCTPEDSEGLFRATTEFWRGWLSQSTYKGRWREMVNRSALTLKMLTHEPSGAVVAAPTTSLPEELGGERNWDFRYVWIRDAAFTLYALLRLGFTDEAAAFMRRLSERLGQQDPEVDDTLGPLRVLYDIDGNVPDQERSLDHLAGYRGSRPVRVGNAAVDQLQLDIYGELIDSVYLFNKYGKGISHDAWQDLTRILHWLIDNWQRDDSGMWEIELEAASRVGPAGHYVTVHLVAQKSGIPGQRVPAG